MYKCCCAKLYSVLECVYISSNAYWVRLKYQPDGGGFYCSEDAPSQLKKT